MTSPRPVGTLPDGRTVLGHVLTAPGIRLEVLDLGATVRSLRLSEDEGPGTEVVLGHPDVTDHVRAPLEFQGAVVGRWANRIAGARLVLDGTVHELAANEGTTCLHGGPDGFQLRTWRFAEATEDTATLELVSPDGDAGFPGRLVARATYRVAPGEVTIQLTATTDAPTVVSLTNHAYLNLAGGGTVADHVLTVEADHWLPVDGAGIPMGVEPVDGTPFDLRRPTRVGDALAATHPQVVAAGGLDHALATNGTGLRRVARLEHPPTGRALDVLTDQPSLQVYTGNALDGTRRGHGGATHPRHGGIALETQRPPDAPNQPDLGPSVLRPGEEYRSTTVWRFGRTAS
ncbi:aldose epimerase family protein [Oryzobacter telluris]|uniref:aldose epimerase family protein n=1 Tax=Oryzobacter telluris TaxID=3149179 RepID=UPI00370DC924